MAKRFELEMFGLDVIMRHDYQTEGVKEKINSYRARSVKELTEFLTNVPKSDKFNSFLDLGCGDAHDLDLFSSLNPNYENVLGLDLYMDKEDYEARVDIIKGDWYELNDYVKPMYSEDYIDVIYMNHSLEHAANVYAVMEQISRSQKQGGVLFIAVPEGNSEFGYSITSSTTHFSVITKGFLLTTLQRFGYNVIVEDREFRKGSPELFAFAIKQRDGI